MNVSLPRRFALAVAVLSLGLASGCLSAPDAPNYRYLTPRAGALEPADLGLAVDVREVTADEGAREVLAWRSTPTRLEHRGSDRWAVRPADFVRRRFVERIGERPANSSAILELELVHFGGAGSMTEPRAEIELFARVSVAGRRTGRTYRAERPIDAADSWRDDLCAALGELTDEVVDAILADVESIAATRGL